MTLIVYIFFSCLFVLIIGLLLKTKISDRYSYSKDKTVSVKHIMVFLWAMIYILISLAYAISSQKYGYIILIQIFWAIFIFSYLYMPTRIKRFWQKKGKSKLTLGEQSGENDNSLTAEVTRKIQINKKKLKDLQKVLYLNPFVVSIDLHPTDHLSVSSEKLEIDLRIRYLKHHEALNILERNIRQFDIKSL